MTRFLKICIICWLGIIICIELGSTDAVENAVLVKKLQELAEKCRVSVGAKADDVQDLFNSVRAKTNEGRCLHACLMKEFQLVDSKGKFLKPAFLEFEAQNFNGNKTLIAHRMRLFDVCLKMKRTNNLCDDAENFIMCMQKN